MEGAVETAELEFAGTVVAEIADFAEIGADFPREGDIGSSFVERSAVVADIDSSADFAPDIDASFVESIVT